MMKPVRYVGKLGLAAVLLLASCGSPAATNQTPSATVAPAVTSVVEATPMVLEPIPENASAGRALPPDAMIEMFLGMYQAQPTSEDLLAYLSTEQRGATSAAQLGTLLQLDGPLTGWTVNPAAIDPATNKATVTAVLRTANGEVRRIFALAPEGMGGELVWHIDSVTAAQ